jgi:hypothetical protein
VLFVKIVRIACGRTAVASQHRTGKMGKSIAAELFREIEDAGRRSAAEVAGVIATDAADY